MAANLRWLSVAEAAAQLSLSERTVRRRCENGKLTARIESTPSGKAWLVCLQSLEETADHVTEGVLEEAPQAQSSTRSQDTAATTTAIVPVLERSVSTPAATPLANAPANSEVLAEVGELRHDVEQIKAYLTGQITAEMRDTLATLPSRDDIRDDLTTAMSAALSPVMQRLEELAGENAQLQTELHAERQKALAQVRRPWWKKLFS
jgi:hypothetical protein